MPNYKVTFDCATGVQDLVEITAEEQAGMDEQAAAQMALNAEQEIAQAQAQEDNETGRAKLKELGLSEAQITALVG